MKNIFKGFLTAAVTLCLIGVLRFLASMLSAEAIAAIVIFFIVWGLSTMVFSGDKDSYD